MEEDSRTLEIPTRGNELIPFDLDELIEPDAIESIISLLVEEEVAIQFWIRIVEEIWRIGKLSDAMDVIDRGLNCEYS